MTSFLRSSSYPLYLNKWLLREACVTPLRIQKPQLLWRLVTSFTLMDISNPIYPTEWRELTDYIWEQIKMISTYIRAKNM